MACRFSKYPGFCNHKITLSCAVFPLLAVFTLIGSSPLLRRLSPSPHHDARVFHDTFLSSATNGTISAYLRDLTFHAHLAGTRSSHQTAEYVKAHFKDSGFQTRVVRYEALLSYPLHAELSLHFGNGSVAALSLSEPGFAESDITPPYHAYSPSGSTVSEAIFVNYGRKEDYETLKLMGVDVDGRIVIARRGESLSRNALVEKAAEKGAAVVLMYTEALDVNGVERGTAMKGLGDPLSPGWGSVVEGEKLDLEGEEVAKRFPKIPSMPISELNAYAILGSLGGAPVPLEWRNFLHPTIVHVGPGPTLLNFIYQGEKKIVTIENVFGAIKGLEEPDRYVLLGNHRDAWTYGAVDPNSGTATLLDIARRYALLMRSGWKPRRTIILCSWDAEEFGMIGSTEWVEQNSLNLGSKTVAYLNVDCAVQGAGFFAGSTPQLDDLLIEVTKKVEDPDSEGITVYEKWSAANGGIDIYRLSRVDSDFAPFLQHAGIPSVDMYFGRDFPVYHTAFDSYNWMINHGDPLFQRHVAVSRLWGVLAIRLADDRLLPFNYISYADQLQEYSDVVRNLLGRNFDVHPLDASIQELASAAKEVQEEVEKLKTPHRDGGDFLSLKERALNDRLMLAERGFLDENGLQGRQWFKHLVYGPPTDSSGRLVFFPGIADAISESPKVGRREEGDARIQHEIWRVARAIQRAASALRGELT